MHLYSHEFLTKLDHYIRFPSTKRYLLGFDFSKSWHDRDPLICVGNGRYMNTKRKRVFSSELEVTREFRVSFVFELNGLIIKLSIFTFP